MEIDSVPVVIDVLERRKRQLDIERRALERDRGARVEGPLWRRSEAR